MKKTVVPIVNPPHLLVVDDMPDSVSLVVAVLRHYFPNAGIYEAYSGAECLDIVARESIDAIVLDAKMPGLDGFEVCRRLKANPRTASIPVLMISGILMESRHKVGGMEAGADGYICKPFENAELAAQIRALLRVKRAEDELRRRESSLKSALESQSEALSKSESRFRVLFDYSPDAVFVENENGVVLDVNQAACSLIGLSRQKLVGMSVYDLVPAEEREAVAKRYPDWFTGKMRELEGYSYTANGRRIPVEIRASLVEYNGEKAVILYVRDISARKKADEALRISEARYRAIVEGQTELITRTLPDTTLTFVNEAVLRYYGATYDQIVGKHCIDLVVPEDRHIVLDAIASLTPERPTCPITFRLVLPDGRARWHQWTKRGIFDERGCLVEVQASGLDVSDQMETERRQQTLLRGMRNVVEIADELIAAVDEDSLYRRAVEFAREKLGLERVGILVNREPWVQGTYGTDYEGRTTDERVKRMPMDKSWKEMMRLRQPNEPRWNVSETPLVYWNGQQTVGDRSGWVATTPIQTAHRAIGIFCNDTAISGAPLDESQQEVVAVYCSLLANIAERKVAESERARLALAVDQSAEAVLISDTKGVIQYVNPGFERMTGFRRDEVIGKTPRLLKSGKHSDAFYRRLWNTLQRGQVWTGRMTNRRRDGTFYEVEHTISPVRDVHGHVISYLSVSQDVTAAVRMEAELRQAQKMESIGRLAGGIAHDFNNLLTAILGFARMVATELSVGSSSYADLQEIINAGERASRLTKQLLSFGRKEVIQVRTIDLNALVASMENILRRTLGEHIELVTELMPAIGQFEADAGQIEQILMNLVINSCDAMPRGGRLTIATGQAELDDEWCQKHVNLRPGSYLTLSVRDNGCGMPEHVRERAFEPFFTTKEKGKGSGLGLATVYGIVKHYRGHVDLISDVNVGTEVTIYFPRATGELSPPVVEEPPTPIQSGNETILVVEDEPVVRKLAVRTLQSLGYHVLEASCGEEALETYKKRSSPIHLVLSDVVMPRISGPDLVEMLHQMEPGLRVLYMSGFAEDVLTRSVHSTSAAALIVKPFTREILAQQVRLTLDKVEDAPPVTPH